MKGLFVPPDIQFDVRVLDAGTRMDANTFLEDGVFLLGGRRYAADTVAGAGKIWKTTDGGKTWALKYTIPGQPNINAMDHLDRLTAYALTGTGSLYVTTDGGETWSQKIAAISNGTTGQGALTYGLCVMPTGTILVSDTNTGGGRLFRSTDGGANFTNLGAPTSLELYRLLKVGSGVICVGWAGKVLRSTNDGATWLSTQVSTVPIYGPGYIGDGIVLVSDGNGQIWRSQDDGVSFGLAATLDGAADDIASLGGGKVLYTPYTSQRNVYFSDDYGKAFRTRGPQPMDGANDNIDRMCAGTLNGAPLVIGSTTQGKIVRMTIA